MADDQGGAGWDFFISYTHSDRPWAVWIAWQLEDFGYRVLVQAWDFVPGSNWQAKMQQGVTDAKRTIAVLSPAYLQSVYGQQEWQAAQASDPLGFARKLVPIRIADCERPGLLASVVSFDLFNLDVDAAQKELREQIRVLIAGRAKPDHIPHFPGGPTTAPPHFPGRAPDRPRSPSTQDPSHGQRLIGRPANISPLASMYTASSGKPTRLRRTPTSWTRPLQLITASYFAFALLLVSLGIVTGRPDSVSTFTVTVGVISLVLAPATLMRWHWVFWVDFVFFLVVSSGFIGLLLEIAEGYLTQLLHEGLLFGLLAVIVVVPAALVVWYIVALVRFGPWAMRTVNG